MIFFTKKSKTVYLQGFWPKSVYLKCFGNQLKTVYLQGPHSLRPCISRPCCTPLLLSSWIEALCWIPSSPHSSLFDMYQHGTPIVLNGKLLKNPNLASHYACMRHLGVIYGQASQSLPIPRST